MVSLIPDNRYRIRYKLQGQQRAREVVALYLGPGGLGGTQLMFSLRPLAGTFMLEPGDIIQSTPVLAGVAISLPKKLEA